jgi:hypothetical protein
MGGIFMKGREVRAVLGITRWKFQEMERQGALKRVHLAFKMHGKKKVPADHGWFKRIEVMQMAGNE